MWRTNRTISYSKLQEKRILKSPQYEAIAQRSPIFSRGMCLNFESVCLHDAKKQPIRTQAVLPAGVCWTRFQVFFE